MKEQITIYDRETRQPVEYRRIAFGSEPIVIAEGQEWYRGFVDATHYFGEDGEPVEKPILPITVEPNRIVGIPIGTSAIVDLQRQAGTIDDGDLTFDEPYPQTFHVTLEHPLFLSWTGEVDYDPGED